MGMMYMLPLEFAYTAANAPMDLLEIVAPTDAVVILHEIFFGQSVSETSEAFDCEIHDGFTSSGSGGAAITPDPIEGGFGAAGGTYETGNTTPASTSGTKRGTIPFNALNGFHYLPTPETRMTISPGQRLVFHLPTDPTVDLSAVDGYALVEEIGG